jgi:23S rRNA (cytidine1920-2'-O)/16S rRNA (cytidine1409-2'-O)-methyltransferase
MKGGKKRRLDDLLGTLGVSDDIETARRLIGSGSVLVNETVCDKSGTLIAESARITVRPWKKYVSRGGDKLEPALQRLTLDPTDWICADIGSSTGGFTDCLLQHGARQVYCVDVGYGLLDWKLRNDDRVVLLERTNARFLSREHLPVPIDLAVIDASFISLEPLLPPLLPLFAGKPVQILALVKPQFQLPRELVEKGGVVTDEARRQQALAMVRQFGLQLGLYCEHVVPAGIRGTKGNQEYFMLLTAPSGWEAEGAKKG